MKSNSDQRAGHDIWRRALFLVLVTGIDHDARIDAIL